MPAISQKYARKKKLHGGGLEAVQPGGGGNEAWCERGGGSPTQLACIVWLVHPRLRDDQHAVPSCLGRFDAVRSEIRKPLAVAQVSKPILAAAEFFPQRPPAIAGGGHFDR